MVLSAWLEATLEAFSLLPLESKPTPKKPRGLVSAFSFPLLLDGAGEAKKESVD